MIGSTFSHYRIVEKPGEGEVYHADDASLDSKMGRISV